ncbi:MAG: imidazole glycerol phosphate synthase subunit HisH [Spirochaetales bacterium]|nr:imidazole glycerol phosphate synthase subunit HisH [Spirochaetales bacterium]
MAAIRVGIVDYKAGNLKSVENAVKHLGADYLLTGNPADFSSVSHLIFPGVGEANAAMSALKETGLGDMIREFYASGKPMLGICLGTQIILSESEEGNTPCLNLVEGKVRRFVLPPEYKVPHIGWNQVTFTIKHPAFEGIPENSSFYFVHSYYPDPENSENIAGQTEYNIRFTSAIAQKNIIAVQFHPEKSGEKGLALLTNFFKWKP